MSIKITATFECEEGEEYDETVEEIVGLGGTIQNEEDI